MKYAVLTSIFLLNYNLLLAQQSIEGIIVDPDENPIGLAHVTNTSLNLGKVSTMNGRFNLLVRRGDTISISYVGYNTETFEVESIHMANYLKITLTEDSLLLPSITIYSDPYFKVPFKYQPQSMDVGIPRSDKEPIKPGSIRGPAGDGVGFTLYGPISAFSKDAREQRKYQDAVSTTSETQYYDRYIETDSVKNKLCKIYHINSETYDRIIVSAHVQYPQIQTMNTPESIWNWLLVYFNEVLN
ncbi:MAG: carboxypeptidase-like regulatory domain-containing protein [Bacteroidota bacterium]